MTDEQGPYLLTVSIVSILVIVAIASLMSYAKSGVMNSHDVYAINDGTNRTISERVACIDCMKLGGFEERQACLVQCQANNQ